MKIRDESIDIAKAILIVLLIFHHIVDFGVREFGVVNPVLEMMRVIQRPLTRGFVLGLLLRPTFISLNGVSLLRSLAPVCFIFISTLAVGLFVAYVINNSVFRFVLGGRLR